MNFLNINEDGTVGLDSVEEIAAAIRAGGVGEYAVLVVSNDIDTEPQVVVCGPDDEVAGDNVFTSPNLLNNSMDTARELVRQYEEWGN